MNEHGVVPQTPGQSLTTSDSASAQRLPWSSPMLSRLGLSGTANNIFAGVDGGTSPGGGNFGGSI